MDRGYMTMLDRSAEWKGSKNCGKGSMEVMLDRFVFRRDDGGVNNSFPENETAARSHTCIGVPFRVCVDLAAPPAISRFYLEWPRGPKPEAGPTCHLVAAHRGCLLIRLTSIVKSKTSPQFLLYPDDYFVYRPAAAAAAATAASVDEDICFRQSLTRLPTWIRPKPGAEPAREEEKEADQVQAEDKEEDIKSDSSDGSGSSVDLAPTKEMLWAERLIRQEHEKQMALGVDVAEEVTIVRSSLVVENVGLVCFSEMGGFLVAELQLDKSCPSRVMARLSLFSSNTSQWELKDLLIDCHKRRDSAGLRCFWPQAVVPFGRSYLCWVDYRRGMVLGDMLELNIPKLSYVPFPPVVPTGREDMHRGVCATNGGIMLKFIDVVANERRPCDTFAFTIFTYTLTRTQDGRGMEWVKDDAVNPMTSEELWRLEAPAPIPHEVPLFPLVSMEKPQILHFLLSECTDYIDTVTLVTIDMNTRAVLSVRPYIKGEQELYGEDADLAEARSSLLQSFLPAEFSISLNHTRYRKRKIQQ